MTVVVQLGGESLYGFDAYRAQAKALPGLFSFVEPGPRADLTDLNGTSGARRVWDTEARAMISANSGNALNVVDEVLADGVTTAKALAWNVTNAAFLRNIADYLPAEEFSAYFVAKLVSGLTQTLAGRVSSDGDEDTAQPLRVAMTSSNVMTVYGVNGAVLLFDSSRTWHTNVVMVGIHNSPDDGLQLEFNGLLLPPVADPIVLTARRLSIGRHSSTSGAGLRGGTRLFGWHLQSTAMNRPALSDQRKAWAATQAARFQFTIPTS